MEFTSYEMVAENTASLNTGSYLNRTEQSLFIKGYASDLWYGFSAKDVMEFGVWDRRDTFVGWNVLHQSKSYNTTTLSYLNTLNFPVTYSYSELNPDFILYKNAKILVDPPTNLSASVELQAGSYFFTYNFTREMAGDIENPLIIKEISPSRQEVKLIPLASSVSPYYTAFCKKRVILQDVSPLYMTAVKYCPYEQVYSKVSSLYKKEIDIIKSIFFLTTDGAVIKFFRNLYEDLIVYTTVPVSAGSIEVITGSLFRIQGIQTSFTNYLLSNSSHEVDFTEVDNHFRGFVSASIERRFKPIGEHPLQPYVNAKAFVYDYFTKYYYQPLSDTLSQTYKEKYFSYFRNALNFGDNQILPILSHGMMDERINPEDPLTLLVRLKRGLPINFAAQTKCWVSNISLSPYVINAIVKSPTDGIIYRIGPPNFSLPIPNVSLTNTNMAYTAEDLAHDNETERELTINRNIAELSVDYTNFQNFVVFSSAELRLKIFKNKVINISAYSSSIRDLNTRNDAFLLASGSTYPFYTQEYDTFQGKITELADTFDGYESYLYRSNAYQYVSGAFVSSSYVTEQDLEAREYDQTNRDSLINNCPGHILSDSNSDDYIIFLSMIGHFFDQIYEYISNIPSERRIGHGATEEFTRRVVDYMLETFGWNLDDSLEQSNLLNNYLTSEQQAGLNSMSAEERLKSVRNRILINLPQIYKTKGTEEAVRLILACYGIPSTLLTIREYGGITYGDDRAAYTTYERAYMYMFQTGSTKYTDVFYNNLSTDVKTYLFKLCLDDASLYEYDRDISIIGRVGNEATAQSISGSGTWAAGFVRRKHKDVGQIWFRIGYVDNSLLKIYSNEFPLFDGNVYNVMIRRNAPVLEYEYEANVDAVPCAFDLFVQRNEFGRQILRLTSSAISYDYHTNHLFSSEASGSYLVRGNWFEYWNGQGLHGAFDKLQVWFDPLGDNSWEDYVNSINSYAFSGSRPAHQSLLFRQHTDYPFDLRQTTGAIGFLAGNNWKGTWRNSNPFYAVDSANKVTAYLGPTYPANMDMDYIYNPWSGSQTLIYDSGSGCWVSQSCYPYQFKVIDYPSTWGVSKYGPNKFRNEKVRHVSQSIEARFDDRERSTYVNPNNVAPDSNQIGFFADPQDFKNKDIIRYFGNFDFMDSIGDPSNQYSSSYDSLRRFRKEYATSLNEYSGSHTLFNELITLYKLYFNRSIFEAIKNVVPARSNALVGVLIEPTVLERPKYPIRPIVSEMNSGSVFYADITASHYFRDPNTKLLRLSMSMVDSHSYELNVSYINLPNRDYPVNFAGNYIGDFMDAYQMGAFGHEIQEGVPEPTIPLPVLVADFVPVPSVGTAPLGVTFINSSQNAETYEWNFDDGGSSTEFEPSHTFASANTYNVSLTVGRGEETATVFQTVTVASIPSLGCGTEVQFKGGQAFPSETTIQLGSGLGTVELQYNAQNVPDKFIVLIDGVVVLDTGYRGQTGHQKNLNKALAARRLPSEKIAGGGSGTLSFVKTTTYPYAVVRVYAPMGGTVWTFTLKCPV